MKKKVAAFILRTQTQGGIGLLLHSFADAPSIPRRVPGGGVYSEETPEQAVYREVLEETGLAQIQLVRKLGVQHCYKPYIQADVERHDFLFRIPTAAPDTWEYQVKGKGADAGEVFQYHWVTADQLDRIDIDEEYRRFITPDYLPEMFEYCLPASPPNPPLQPTRSARLARSACG